MDFRFRFQIAIAFLASLVAIAVMLGSYFQSVAQESEKRHNFEHLSGMAALIKGNQRFPDDVPHQISKSFAFTKSLAATNWPNIPVITVQRPQNETSIVVSPSDPLNLVGVWNDLQRTTGTNVNSNAGYGYSTNGGATWQTGLITTPYHTQFDPAVVSDKNGNFYCCFVALDTTEGATRGGIFVSKSNAASKGATWGTPVVVVDHPTEPSPFFEDKPYIAVDITDSTYSGNLYVSWTRLSPYSFSDTSRIMFTKSTNGGTSFSSNFIELEKAVIQSLEFGPEDVVQGSIPAVGPNGEVYVAWLKYDNHDLNNPNKNFIRSKKSTNGGSSFGSLITVAGIKAVRYIKGNLEAPSFPTMAVDRNNGYIYIVWSAKSNSGDLDIYLSKSTNGGTSWSASPVRVNQDPTSNGKDQCRVQ